MRHKELGMAVAAAALAVSADPVVANVAVNALVALKPVETLVGSLTAASTTNAPGALRALQQIHEARAVTGLIESLSEVKAGERRGDILQALARLHFREGAWRGTLQEWWGTRPDTTGPYYDPVAWEESARIAAVLKTEIRQVAQGASATPMPRYLADLQRNRLLPQGASDLLTTMAANKHAALTDTADLLIGRVRLDVDRATAARLETVAKIGPVYREGVLRMVAMAGVPTNDGGDMLRAAAVDRTLPVTLRASVLTTLATGTGPDALARSIDAFAAAVQGGTIDAALEGPWRAFVAAPTHATSVASFRTASTSADEGRQVLGYAVLAQLAAEPAALGGRGRAAGGGGGGGARGGRGGAQAAAVEAARTEARAAIEGSWALPSTPSLVRAIGLVNATMYRDQVERLRTSAAPAVRDAAVFSSTRLASAAAAPVPVAGGRGGAAPGAPVTPLVSAVAYEEVVTRLASVTGTAAVGRTLFERQGCIACHTTAPGEAEKGPYLGGIALRYNKAELVESILRPSAKVAQGFATNMVTTTDNRQLSGFVVREGPTEIVMRDLTGVETTIAKTMIRSRTSSEGSIMPPGLADNLTLAELASLIAFLESTSPK